MQVWPTRWAVVAHQAVDPAAVYAQAAAGACTCTERSSFAQSINAGTAGEGADNLVDK